MANAASLGLTPRAQRILRLLVEYVRTHKIVPSDPSTFIGYKPIHDALGLNMVGTTYGESLSKQGLGELAQWTKDKRLPAITGLIVDQGSLMPGKGYFEMFERDEMEFRWWQREIEQSLVQDWTPYL